MPREWLEQRLNARHKGRHDPLADPLNGESWRGLEWILPLLTLLVRPAAGSGPSARAAEPESRPLRPIRSAGRS